MPSILKSIEIFHQTSLEDAPATDDSSNAPSILAINGFFAGFTLLIVLARLYVRTFMLRSMGLDDWLISAAMLCGVGVFVCFLGETSHGVGKFSAAISQPEMVKMLHWQFFHQLLVTVGISLIKISVACFLLRLVPSKSYKIFLWCMIAFLTAFTLSSAGTLIFSCIPVQAAWDLSLAASAKCFSNATFTAIGLFNSSVNILTDIIFALLPIPMVWNLQVNKRTKVTLIIILSLGLFACAASIIKTVIQSKVFSTPDMYRNDSYFIWNSIELYVGILAASLPSLRPLFKRFLETTKNMRTRRTGMSSSGNGVGARHKYYMQEDGIGMDSLPGQVHRSGKYDVKVTTSARSHPSTTDDYGMKADSDSDDILPLQGRGITKTVDVTIS